MAPKPGENPEDVEEVEMEEDDNYDDESFEDDEDVEEEVEEPAPKTAAQAFQSANAPSQAPRGLPGLPARGMPALPPRTAAPQQQQQQQPSPAAAAATATPAATAAAQSAAAQTAGGPKLPARGGLGLPGLPPRAGLGGSATASTAPASTPAPAAAQSQPAPPATTTTTSAAAASRAGAGPALPPRGMPGLPARPAGLGGQPAAAAAASQAAPARPAAAPGGAAPAGGSGASPSLPARPGFLRPPGSVPAASAVAAPPRPAPSNDVVDLSEEKKVQRIQRRVQEIRVNLIRAAGRLGIRYDSENVTQFLQVIERVETMAGASLYKGSRRVDLVRSAEREARELDSREAADSRLDIKIKIMVIGMTGTGKSELINAMLEKQVAKTSPFSDTTKRIKVIKGSYKGMQIEFIDTPGLHAASTAHTENKNILKRIKAAYKWHKPNYVFYVDRVDAARPALGELTLLSLINQQLGAKVWRETMIVLTHAHACRAAMGAQYDTFTRQRRNIVMQLIRQAAGDPQVRNPMYLVDCHPSCPTNSFGQPVILDGNQNVPWKQGIFMQLVGYRAYEEVSNLFKSKSKAAAAAASANKQDLFRQLMRPRLPPVSFFVEQMAEGIQKPETWAAMDDPLDQETEDEEAEEFQHMYYKLMYQLARQGNPWAQKEYALMLKRLSKLRRTYADAFENEDLEMMASSGYEGYVAEGLDLGPTFDPEDGTNHRYCYLVPESDWQVMPTLDYYGYEHEDAITGFVAEYDSQLMNRDGWCGFPLSINLAVEKDKTSTCLQGESHLSIVHAVPPFGSRHITQVGASFELLRPNLKDVLYTLEVNTFKDGFLRANDHAGFGVMMARLGEGGKVNKGPMGMGLRLQDNFRLGAFKIDASAAKVQTEAGTGGKDEAWGGRAFVRYDWIPGLGMVFDFYQQRTKETEDQLGGVACNFTYDFEVLGAAAGVEVDFIAGGEAMHVDLNLFSCKDYRLAWLLVLPAVNWVKGKWQQWREARQGGGEEMAVEGEEGEEGQEMDLSAMMPGMFA